MTNLQFHPNFCEDVRVKLSACIIAKNEEEYIARAINSLSFADQIIVVDSGSDDRTIEIAESLGAECHFRKWTGFSDQKQYATDLCSHDWVFSLDADEHVSTELASEIESLKPLLAEIQKTGFKIPRLTSYLGRPINYSGWYPDYQLRLFRKDAGAWNQRAIHESFLLENPELCGYLDEDILHDSVSTIDEHKQMIDDRYGPLGAAQLAKEGRRVSSISLYLEPIAVFLKTLLLRLGFLDGYRGVMISYFAAYNVYVKKHLRFRQIREKLPAETVE